ncbi:hypothetical protein [Nesterenkonia ebinurensis]|uniref:hypothetical protein n=1 Tax=Nesterenkonia ebinurensis TaxID=2608252 RepID=UPI00123D0E0D|nr:hypothetical protein [Nesterenkonia ebinurensis]
MSRRGRTQQALAEESGQTTVLILGLVSIVLMLAAVIISASIVNVESRKLLSEADAAASSAALAAQPAPGTPQLTEQQIVAAAQDYLSEAEAHHRHHDLAVTGASISGGGDTITVELRAEAELPVLRWVLPATVEVTAESHARITVNR